VGDRLLKIDGKSVSKPEDLSFGKDKDVRMFGFVQKVCYSPDSRQKRIDRFLKKRSRRLGARKRKVKKEVQKDIADKHVTEEPKKIDPVSDQGKILNCIMELEATASGASPKPQRIDETKKPVSTESAMKPVEAIVEPAETVVGPSDVNVIVLPITRGTLGLSIQFSKFKGGAVITAVDPLCKFKDKVNVGDRLLKIDGKSVCNPEDLSFGKDKDVRMFGFVQKVCCSTDSRQKRINRFIEKRSRRVGARKRKVDHEVQKDIAKRRLRPRKIPQKSRKDG